MHHFAEIGYVLAGLALGCFVYAMLSGSPVRGSKARRLS